MLVINIINKLLIKISLPFKPNIIFETSGNIAIVTKVNIVCLIE